MALVVAIVFLAGGLYLAFFGKGSTPVTVNELGALLLIVWATMFGAFEAVQRQIDELRREK